MNYQAYELETVLKLNEIVEMVGGYDTNLDATAKTEELITLTTTLITRHVEYYHKHDSHLLYGTLGHINELAKQLKAYSLEGKYDLANNTIKTLLNNIKDANHRVNNFLADAERYGWEYPKGFGVSLPISEKTDTYYTDTIEVIVALAHDIASDRALLSDSAHAIKIARALVKLDNFLTDEFELYQSPLAQHLIEVTKKAVTIMEDDFEWYINSLHVINELGKELINEVNGCCILHGITSPFVSRYKW